MEHEISQRVNAVPLHGMSFDRAISPFLVLRTAGSANAAEVRRLIARLERWLSTKTSLLAMWVDSSDVPGPWLDEVAATLMARWMMDHREELRMRRIVVAFVSPSAARRRELEPKLSTFEMAHRITLEVFARESSARSWLRAHGIFGGVSLESLELMR